MIFPAPSAKIMMFQRRANALERGTGISSPVRVYMGSAFAANSHTSPSVGGDMMDVIFTPKFQQRFWAKVNKSGPNGCWEWTGALSRGYGSIGVTGYLQQGAHRIAYLILVGQIPERMHLDHLCRNPKCVNPAHLEPVTSRENTLRGVGHPAVNAAKTHCKFGHPLSGDNLYRDKRGRRECLCCKKALAAKWHAKKKQERS